jgi:HAD superfamily hydrolase (TIGR01509 family)
MAESERDIASTARAVLWDLDGTLVDSEASHYLSWRSALALEGIDFTPEKFRELFGRRNDATLRALFGADLPDSEVERIAGGKERAYRAEVRAHGATLLPGAARWLEALAAAGWRQAVVSSAPRENVETLVDVLDIGRYFGALVGGEDVLHGKPDPEPFLTAAALLGVDPARSVVVEDAPAGLQSARAAHMRAVGVLTTHSHLEADVVVASLADLPDDTFDRLVTS